MLCALPTPALCVQELSGLLHQVFPTLHHVEQIGGGGRRKFFNVTRTTVKPRYNEIHDIANYSKFLV